MVVETSAVEDVSSRLDGIIAIEERAFVERQPRSRAMRERANHSLAGGVTSSWQITTPQAVWLSHGAGSKIYDVDGHEYVDLHGGYGAGLAGHGHPAIVDAVRGQVGRGTHFAQPTEAADRGGRGAGRPVRAAAVAVRQLGYRGHHGRRPPDAGLHRPGPDHQGRGLLSRSPRLGPGVGGPRAGRGRSGRRAAERRRQLRHPVGHHRPDPGRRLQRPRRRPPHPGGPPGPGGRHDPRTHHDERRDHHPRPRLSGRTGRSCSTPMRRS